MTEIEEIKAIEETKDSKEAKDSEDPKDSQFSILHSQLSILPTILIYSLNSATSTSSAPPLTTALMRRTPAEELSSF